MASGTFTADGNTSWFLVQDNNGIHVAGKGTFGAGTVKVQQTINGNTYTLLDDLSAEISHTANFDRTIGVRTGDIIRLNLSGATAPAIDWMITGESWEQGQS
jgi:hypothetical protein